MPNRYLQNWARRLPPQCFIVLSPDKDAKISEKAQQALHPISALVTDAPSQSKIAAVASR
jgi:hypothetical protein